MTDNFNDNCTGYENVIKNNPSSSYLDQVSKFFYLNSPTKAIIGSSSLFLLGAGSYLIYEVMSSLPSYLYLTQRASELEDRTSKIKDILNKMSLDGVNQYQNFDDRTKSVFIESVFKLGSELVNSKYEAEKISIKIEAEPASGYPYNLIFPCAYLILGTVGIYMLPNAEELS